MAKAIATVANKPVWVDLATPDAEASRDFYSKLFGWQVEVNEDPQYGGYGLAKIGGNDVAGIGPKQSPEQPTVWTVYIGTDDIAGLAEKVKAAGGKVITEPFDVGDQGRMAVFQDPSGAFISAWQATQMRGFGVDKTGTFGWAELNARGKEKALPFYEQVFGWTSRESPMGEGQPAYTEFLLDDQSIAGGWEMNPMIPAEVPSYWQIYFNVDDVDSAFRKVLDLGGKEMVSPQDFPGGRFAIVQDPQGASFGLLKTTPR
jgi:predicted enzyme related to lactoylglutathione lyase